MIGIGLSTDFVHTVANLESVNVLIFKKPLDTFNNSILLFAKFVNVSVMK